MDNNQVHSVLEQRYDIDIADKVLQAFFEIEENYFLEKWKPSELDAGHFVEAVRRIIESELFGQYTPFGDQLPNFNDQILKRYEQQQGHESFRMLIPRILKSIYNIRNKRGVGHINDISPNEMDATMILYNVKWVLAEIIRLSTNLSIQETQKIIDTITERNTELLWKSDDIYRVLNTNINAKEQVIILLYDESPQKLEELQNTIEYRNSTNFLKIIRELHKKRFLEFTDNSLCYLSPKGKIEAERLIKQYKN